MDRYPTAVNRFRGDYAFLSNFYPAKLCYEGIAYYNAEAAYQAQKCADPAQKMQFAKLYADEAKRAARGVSLREDWDRVKLGIMEQIIQAKFEQNPRLAQLLLDTGDMQLVEGNTWHDLFWGVDLKTGVGENRLGRLLMGLRETFKAGGITDRSGQRPVREYRFENRLILTDESVPDLDVEYTVRELDGQPAGQALLWDAGTVGVYAPVYGKDGDRKLYECYWNCLDTAAGENAKSIALGAVSVKKNCFPKRKAAQLAAAAVLEWMRQQPDVQMQIYLAPEDIRLMEYLLEGITGCAEK